MAGALGKRTGRVAEVPGAARVDGAGRASAAISSRDRARDRMQDHRRMSTSHGPPFAARRPPEMCMKDQPLVTFSSH